MRLLSLTFLLLISLFPLSLHAQNKVEPKPPETLARMVSKGAQIFYLGNYEGMNGWALVRKGKPEYFYENKERTALVMGVMFNIDGELLTMAQLSMLKDRIGEDAMYAMTDKPEALADLESTATTKARTKATKMVTQPQAVQQKAVTKQPVKVVQPVINRPVTKAERMYVDLIGANRIIMNPEGAHEILAFIDPDCPHCQNMVRNADQFMGPDGLKVHMIPVGMAEQSIQRAAMLLAIGNPIEKLQAHVNGDPSALNPPANINIKAVEQNIGLMYKYGFDVTPLIVYKTGQGEIRMVRGVPSDYNSISKDIKDN